MKTKPHDFVVDGPSGAPVWIYQEPVEGLAFRRGDSDTILLNHSHKPSKELLNTTMHECLHMCIRDHTHGTIDRYAKFMTEVLWRAGYRIVPKKRKKRKTKTP